MQKSMVLALDRAPRSGVYVLQDVCEFREEVNPALLKQAWAAVAARHGALRTRIVPGAELRQQVVERPEISWQEFDCAQDRVAAFLRQDRERGFDLNDGVPLRFTLLRTAPDSWTLVWTIHHALIDGRSLQIVWREWLAVYDGEPDLPAAGSLLPIERSHPANAEDYWHEYFDGVSQTTGYIVDRAAPFLKAQSEPVAKEYLSLSEELTEDLWRFALKRDVTVHTLVQAAWALALSRHSDRSDIVFGVTRAGRSQQGAVGLFMNTLPFRVTVPAGAQLTDWLKQIRRQWTEQREYQGTPLDSVWKWSGLPPGMPPFESVLVYDHEPVSETLGRPGRTFRRLQRTGSVLTLIAYGRPLVALEIAYDTRLFSEATVRSLLGHLQTLLASFVSQEDSRLAALRMLTDAEEERLVHGLNSSVARYPRGCVHRLFEQQAARAPGNTALESGDARISYRETNARSNQLARALREKGAGPGDVIGVRMPRSPDAVIACLAILKAGAAFLPLDPAQPAARLSQMIEDAGAKLVLTESLQVEAARYSDENLPDFATLDDPAYAIYTSGTTGKPKAVLVPHRGLANHTHAITKTFGITAADRRLQFAPIGTDVFVAEIFNYLCNGATLVFASSGQGQSVQQFLQVLEDRRITTTGIPTTWWNEWVSALHDGAATIPSSLRAVIAGTERVDPEIFLSWKRLAGGRVRWFNAYGPTETSLTATVYEAGSSEWEGGPFVPIGKPHPNTQAYVLDAELNLAPMGVAGELCIGGEGVALGYLNAPELTAEKFVPDPYRPGSRLYRTGDLVFSLPDGNLVFLGRQDRQVKIRGFRVELEEIEGAIARLPGVRQCAVILDRNGSLVAYVTPAGQPAELRRQLSRLLPDHMLPSAFVTLTEMPLTRNGKIDRQSLPPYWPDPASGARDFEPPSTETEKRLAGLWRRVLKTPSVGLTDNFFELGGDSMKGAQLLTLIHTQFEKELPFATLLQAPTLARMGALLDGRESGNLPATEPGLMRLNPHGSQLPLFLVSSAGNDQYCFRHIANFLGADQPVFALGAPIEDGRPLQTVAELAGRVCRSIREEKPSGPYLVGGYCFGGVVAYETARQLIADGDDVRRVILFDTATPGYPKIAQSRGRYMRYLRELLSSSAKIRLDEIREHALYVARLLKKKAIVQTQRAVGPALAGASAADLATFTERSARIYQPKPISAPISHFIAQQETVSVRILEDPRLGWRNLCTGEFQVHHVPSLHQTLFLEEQAADIAAILRKVLTGALS